MRCQGQPAAQGVDAHEPIGRVDGVDCCGVAAAVTAAGETENVDERKQLVAERDRQRYERLCSERSQAVERPAVRLETSRDVREGNLLWIGIV